MTRLLAYNCGPYGRGQHGFTLLELLATLAIAAILLGLAVPSLQSFHGDSEIVATTNDIVSSIHAARSEAVTQTGNAGVCPSNTPLSVNAVCDANAQWTEGWIAFFDDNGDGERDPGTDSLLVQMEPRSGGFTITPDGTFGDIVYFSFNGTSITKAGAPVSGKLTVKYGNSENREITVSANGHVTTEVK